LHCEWSGETTNKTAEREGGRRKTDDTRRAEEKRRRQSRVRKGTDS
jgi:hypothetical protein